MINYDKKLFNINITSNTQPHPGTLLVSEPFLKEDYFNHSVIYLVEYERGSTAMGIVMNQPTRYSLSSVLPEIKRKDVMIYCGGPMSCDRLYFLHTLGNEIIPNSREVSPGTFIGGNFTSMTEYINAGYPVEEHIRFFLGYSGWSREQLDEELESKVWAVAEPPVPAQLLSGDKDAYWHRFVRSLGNDFRGWRYHPRNPQSN